MNMSSIDDLYQGLVETEKSTIYPLIDRLIRLILTLPVSTATTERAFSVIRLLKQDFAIGWRMIFLQII
jgi:hypothetical protein